MDFGTTLTQSGQHTYVLGASHALNSCQELTNLSLVDWSRIISSDECISKDAALMILGLYDYIGILEYNRCREGEGMS